MSASDSPGGDEVSLTLTDGTLAHIVADKGGFALQIEGTRQSHIGPASEPPKLAVTRWMLAALAELEPSSIAHLGGGLLTLPRYLAHKQPQLRQVVIESEPALVDANLRLFPPPRGIELRTGDGLEWVELTTEAFDAITVDVFAGGRIPGEFTTVEFYGSLARHLSGGGRVVINSVAGPELDFTRGQLASMSAVFDHVIMIVQGSSLAGARFGNAVLIGSQQPIDVDAIRRRIRGDASRAGIVTDIGSIVGDATPVTAERATWSPVPDVPNLQALEESLRPLRAMGAELKRSLGQARDSVRAGDERAAGSPRPTAQGSASENESGPDSSD